MPWCGSGHPVLRVTASWCWRTSGLNSCVVGEEEVLGGQTGVFEPGTKVRIWPYTLTFEAEKAATDQPQRAGSPPAVDHGRPGAEDPPEAAGTARPVPVRNQPRQRPAEHPPPGKQHRGRLPRAERLRPRERAAGRGDHRPDAPRPPGQPDHHGDGGRRHLRHGRADLQRVRPAGHARAGARGGAARPA